MIAVAGVDRLLQQIGHGVYSSLMTSTDTMLFGHTFNATSIASVGHRHGELETNRRGPERRKASAAVGSAKE